MWADRSSRPGSRLGNGQRRRRCHTFGGTPHPPPRLARCARKPHGCAARLAHASPPTPPIVYPRCWRRYSLHSGASTALRASRPLEARPAASPFPPRLPSPPHNNIHTRSPITGVAVIDGAAPPRHPPPPHPRLCPPSLPTPPQPPDCLGRGRGVIRGLGPARAPAAGPS